MLPSPTDLNFLLEVANTKNLTRASERLGVTQPALSQSIKRLEKTYGLPVLVRSKSGVKLTRAGEKLVRHARVMLNDWNRIKEDALKDETILRGRYSIGCHVSVAMYSLHLFLPELVKQYPELEIKLQHDLSRKITEEVISFKLDFGIVVNPVPHPDLVVKELFKDEVRFWRSKKLLKNNNVLICDPELVQSQTILNAFNKSGGSFQRIITTSSLEVVCQLVEEGAGIGIIPSRVVKQNDKAKLLKPVSNSPKFLDRICLVYRVDNQRSQAAKTVTRAIAQALRE